MTDKRADIDDPIEYSPADRRILFRKVLRQRALKAWFEKSCAGGQGHHCNEKSPIVAEPRKVAQESDHEIADHHHGNRAGESAFVAESVGKTSSGNGQERLKGRPPGINA